MFLEFYNHIPQKIDPIAFSVGSFDVRWYSLSYIIGLLVIFLVLNRALSNSILEKNVQIFKSEPACRTGRFLILNKKIKFQISNLIVDFLLLSFFAALIGGRLGYVLLYDLSYFIDNPLEIFLPFKDGVLTGFYGMSYFGALAAVTLSSICFLRYKKIDFWTWADFVAPAAALGYFFGRMGNFLNGELYGKPTESVFGMYFPIQPSVLRHPSQLYEAILEGIVLYIILQFLWKKRKFKSGSIFSFYLIGYGFFRIISEFFRQNDKQSLIGSYSKGVLFSALLIVVGIFVFVYVQKNNSKESALEK